MSAERRYAFQPDYTIHPGEILGETLQARAISQSELASRCGLSEKHVSQIINGRASITSETALMFEQVLGVRARLWMSLESNHRLHLARTEEQHRLAAYAEWSSRFPIQALAKLGWLPTQCTDADCARALLRFFGVTSPSAWEKQYEKFAVAYRKSPAFQSSMESISAWLRIGTLEATKAVTETFDKARFQQSLREIRSLTHRPASEFEPRMKQLCNDAGVALVFVPELPKTYLSGATRWISSDKALIMQSLRYRKDDHFWFTFFHEAAHVLQHGKRSVFIDGISPNDSEEEQQADAFAANHLIPSKSYASLVRPGRPSRNEVIAFAKRQEIAPGIVVGRLQHDRIIPFDRFNDLKRTFVFGDEPTS
ncbi:HigA family addiction module antidote protein [Candidatus Bipolaricaulota bacterium]|nr:HigA family addiction module antidote protein [Candidatus Bipolaricaulota bacterium]